MSTEVFEDEYETIFDTQALRQQSIGVKSRDYLWVA
jgi:hypothetical protein